MRKSEMSNEQIKLRSEIIEYLKEKGWEDNSVHDWFEKNLWSSEEVNMKTSNQNLKLEANYSISEDILYFTIELFNGKSIELHIYPEGEILSLLSKIIQIQDSIDENNFDEKIQIILKSFPETYYMRPDGKLFHLTKS